jgi:hypothetical protein
MGGDPFDRRESKRFSRALLVALGVHALALLGHGVRSLAEHGAPERAQQLWIEVRPNETRADSTTATRTARTEGRSDRAERVASRGASRSTASADSAEVPPVLELPAPSAPSTAGPPPRLTLEQLGISPHGHSMTWLMPPPTDQERAELDRQRQELRARALADREKIRRARGVEAPVIPPLLSLIRNNAVAPDSTALISIRLDDTGRVVGAKVLNASRDMRTWRRVARALVPALGGARLALHTSSGVDIRIRASSFLRMPSGARVGESGSHWSPLQFSQSFDVSDIGAVPVLDAEAKLEAITAADPDERVQ